MRRPDRTDEGGSPTQPEAHILPAPFVLSEVEAHTRRTTFDGRGANAIAADAEAVPDRIA